MFLQNGKWLVIPETLYFALLLLFGFLAVMSIIALLIGTVKKRKAKYFLRWGIVVIISAIYLTATLRLGWIVANTMIGG